MLLQQTKDKLVTMKFRGMLEALEENLEGRGNGESSDSENDVTAELSPGEQRPQAFGKALLGNRQFAGFYHLPAGVSATTVATSLSSQMETPVAEFSRIFPSTPMPLSLLVHALSRSFVANTGNSNRPRRRQLLSPIVGSAL